MTKKVISRKVGLKALNDIVIIVEDAIDYEVDKPSGLTSDVVKMIREGKLAIPETSEFYAKKYPCTGKVISVGSKCIGVEVGNKVVFARQGGLREKIDGRDIVFIRQQDIHAIVD